MGAILLLGVGVLLIRDRVEASSDAGVRADFIPAERIERVPGTSAERRLLKDMLTRSEWSVLLFFRPTDCYPCVRYAQQLEDALRTHRPDSPQIAAVAVDTNGGEIRSFLRSVGLPYPVFVAPERSEAQSLYRALDEIGPTPLLVLSQGQRVRYATRLLPDGRIMEERYSNLLGHLQQATK